MLLYGPAAIMTVLPREPAVFDLARVLYLPATTTACEPFFASVVRFAAFAKTYPRAIVVASACFHQCLVPSHSSSVANCRAKITTRCLLTMGGLTIFSTWLSQAATEEPSTIILVIFKDTRRIWQG